MMKKRLTALLLCLCMVLEPLALSSAETEHSHAHETLSGEEAAAAPSVTLEDGSPLPERYLAGDPLHVGANVDGVAFWRYAIDYIGYSETFAVDQSVHQAAANDAGTAAVRALKGWRISDGAPASLRISALDRRKNVLCESEIALDLSKARIVQITGLPLPEQMTYGDLFTLAVSNGTKITRWQYKLSQHDGTSLATTASASADVAKALAGCLQSALRWGSVDLSQPLLLQIAGYNAESVQITDQVSLRVSFSSSAMLADDGSAIPAYLSEEALLGKSSPLVLKTVSGGEAVWSIRAYDRKGALIGEETTAPCAAKEISYFSLVMQADRYARHIEYLEITAAQNGETSSPVTVRIGYGCPACGEETKTENAHYVKNCGHYRCDGYDHYQANCHQAGHCNAYHTTHTIKCADCRIRLCSEEGYNPENCRKCDACHKMLCITQDLDHTVCEGCGYCLWYTNGGEHTTCEYCGLYLCTEEGRSARHDVLKCGEHAYCNNGGIYHKRGDCGIGGHYTCDGQEHAACPTCKLFACSDEYAALNHEQCEICGMRRCDKNYTWAAHQLCAHCGGWLCEPGSDHRQHNCGIEGHYRCDGRWHNAEVIDKYCDATPQHKKCQGDPEHYCDPEDGGCGLYYPCSHSNRHTRCTMCGLRWCDRSNGGHETPCGVRSHRPCQVSRFRRSEHLDCEFCGNPKCVGMHATCGVPFTCEKCWAKYYQPGDHTLPCGHLKCAKGDHTECAECGGFYCDTALHVKDAKDDSVIICLAPKPEQTPDTAP